ncbi:MAG: glycosyltransferase family 2 protein, partial [Aurantimicrobium sp.]
AGAQAARYPNMLLLDSRILMGEHSLKHIELSGISSGTSGLRAWNGHSITDPQANLVGHFWEVPTYVFWGSYLSHPQPTVITAENFNKVPKGTTFFMCPTALFIEASQANWPEENANLTNDDTKIIRHIVTPAEVLIDPGFWALYRPRTNTKAFVKHTYARGTTFVDGFAGISVATNTAILLAALAPVLALIIVVWLLISSQLVVLLSLLALALLALSLPAVIAAVHRCPGKGIRSYFVYALIFAVPYWAGIIRGTRLHGRALFHTKRKMTSAA